MKTILAGLRWSKECGDHPGTVPLLCLVGLGAAAGGFVGALVMTAIYGPMFLWGCWCRGKMVQAAHDTARAVAGMEAL
jgi:hypothetical protein